MSTLFDPFVTEEVLSYVYNERQRQHNKWGEQNHDEDRWMVILGEEFGECCKAVFENDSDNYREELIQIAAVAVAAVEAFDRKFK